MLWQEHFDLGHAGLEAVEDYFPFFPIPPAGMAAPRPCWGEAGMDEEKKKKNLKRKHQSIPLSS